MARRCFLHVGSPKTGTTYLQDVAWASRDELARQGLVLPLERTDHFALSLVLRDQVDPEVDGERVTTVVDRLVEAVAGTGDDVLITQELLATVEPDRAAAFLARLDADEVHVVVTARDWGRQLPSGWQQNVKTRRRTSLEAFVAGVRENPGHTFNRNQRFHLVAQRWGATLPPSRVHVVTVPRPGAPRGLLLERYCRVLGVDPGGLTTDVEAANTSLAHEPTELLRRVNGALGDRLPKPRAGYNRAVKFWFAEEVLAPLGGTRIALPRSARRLVAEEGAEQVRALEAAGYDVVGDLTELLPDDAAGGAADGSAGGGPVDRGPDDSVLLGYAVEALAATLTQRSADQATIRRLRRQLARARDRSQDRGRRDEGRSAAAGADHVPARATSPEGPRALLRRARRRLAGPSRG